MIAKDCTRPPKGQVATIPTYECSLILRGTFELLHTLIFMSHAMNDSKWIVQDLRKVKYSIVQCKGYPIS